MNKSTGIKRSIIALIGHRGIDSNIARHVRTNAENCFWCGASIANQKGVNGSHADHVVPRAKGGGDNIANLVPSCSTCNRKKRSKDPVQFAREVGADIEAVEKIVAAHRAGSSKKITVFHVDTYCLDAFVFSGFDRNMIEDVKETVSVRFHVLNNGYRAFTAPCIIYEFMKEEFEHFGYELIDRRGKTCPREKWVG